MNWQINKYEKLVKADKEAIKLATSLLRSYPLTRVALDVLKKDLLTSIEVGLMQGGELIIKQGERGKDLFLILGAKIDVLVNDKRVVQMDSPALLGDKAIIESDSTRAASIQIAEGEEAWVLKIPMGLFLRDETHAEIPDKTFKRERDLYSGLFEEIQKRLFDFVHLQKNAFETLTAAVNQVNARWAAVVLDKGEDKNWPDAVFLELEPFLAARFGLKYPKGMPHDIKKIRDDLHQQLFKTFPKESFQGNPAEYAAKSQRAWSRWLHLTAKQILKNLSQDQVAFTLKGINLFNPLNYRDTIVRMMGRIEAYYPKKDEQGEPKKKSGFFKSGGHANLFEMSRFQDYIQERYRLRFPYRAQAKMASATAQIAAECENQFNSSLTRIKEAMEKLDALELESQQSAKPEFDAKAALAHLANGFANVNRHVSSSTMGSAPTGECHFETATSPKLGVLLQTASTQVAKDRIGNSIYNLAEAYGLIRHPIDRKQLEEELYIVQGLPDFKVPQTQLEDRYWIPLSLGIRLMRGDQEISELLPGSILGGKCWHNPEADPSEKQLYLKMPPRDSDGPIDQSSLFLVVSHLDLRNFSFGNPLEKAHWMEWVKNRHFDDILRMAAIREEGLEQLLVFQESSQREEKIKRFESQALPLTHGQIDKVLKFLKSYASLDEVKEGFSTKLLSDSLYQNLLAKERAGGKGDSDEEIRNRVYTQWRWLLAEVVQLVEESEGKAAIEEVEEDSAPILVDLSQRIEAILEEKGIEDHRNYLRLDEEPPTLELIRLFESLNLDDDDRTDLFCRIMVVLQDVLLNLRLEVKEIKTRLSEHAEEQGDQTEGLQRKLLIDLSEKFAKAMSA